jgi:AraC-like DNA-binding protein
MRPIVTAETTGPSLSLDGHRSWLTFIDVCQVAVGRSQLDTSGDPQAVVPSLFDAAGRLDTHAERLLGAVVVFQIAGRIRTSAGGSPDSPFGLAADDRADLLRGLTTGASQASQTDARVTAVMRYVQTRHLKPDCRLVEVAQQLRLSRTHLSRLVLRQTGFTIKHHLQVTRMHSAAKLLTETDMSIKEIASATGYEHVPSFDRKFRRYFQLTPGRYRRLGSSLSATNTRPEGESTG